MTALPKVIEITATLVGFLNIYLATRANIWNWFFGIIAVSLYFIVFLMAKLYANAGLQVIYFVFQVYGFWQWRNKKYHLGAVTHMPKQAYLTSVVAFAGFNLMLIYLLSHYTDSNTVLLDAANTSLCLIAQWMMVRKWPENWCCWSIANLIALVLYIEKSLYYMAVLHVMFLALNFYGYQQWSAMALDRKQKQPRLSSV